MYTGGILLIVLVLLFVVPKFNSFLKKRKEKMNKKRPKESKRVVEVKFVQKENFHKKPVKFRNVLSSLIVPFVLVVLLGLFMIFESQVVEFVRGYAIDLVPINYVSLFTLVGLIFITRGAILTLGNKENKNLKSFVWIMHGFVLTVVALFYDLIHYTHIEFVGRSFSALLVLLVIWEVVSLVAIFRSYKKVV
jgi:hypothetical protein